MNRSIVKDVMIVICTLYILPKSSVNSKTLFPFHFSKSEVQVGPVFRVSTHPVTGEMTVNKHLDAVLTPPKGKRKRTRSTFIFSRSYYVILILDQKYVYFL